MRTHTIEPAHTSGTGYLGKLANFSIQFTGSLNPNRELQPFVLILGKLVRFKFSPFELGCFQVWKSIAAKHFHVKIMSHHFKSPFGGKVWNFFRLSSWARTLERKIFRGKLFTLGLSLSHVYSLTYTLNHTLNIFWKVWIEDQNEFLPGDATADHEPVHEPVQGLT